MGAEPAEEIIGHRLHDYCLARQHGDGAESTLIAAR